MHTYYALAQTENEEKVMEQVCLMMSDACEQVSFEEGQLSLC